MSGLSRKVVRLCCCSRSVVVVGEGYALIPLSTERKFHTATDLKGFPTHYTVKPAQNQANWSLLLLWFSLSLSSAIVYLSVSVLFFLCLCLLPAHLSNSDLCSMFCCWLGIIISLLVSHNISVSAMHSGCAMLWTWLVVFRVRLCYDCELCGCKD